MASLNKVFLIGRLGSDPVVKSFSNSNSIAEVNLATDEGYTDKSGQKIDRTEWHRLKFPFTSLAQRAEKFLKKGMLIHVEGRIQSRQYEDEQKVKRSITEIAVDNFTMLTPKSSESTAQPNQSSPTAYQPSEGESLPQASGTDDDLPF
jgi:single-strand DNA-binding protein